MASFSFKNALCLPLITKVLHLKYMLAHFLIKSLSKRLISLREPIYSWSHHVSSANQTVIWALKALQTESVQPRSNLDWGIIFLNHLSDIIFKYDSLENGEWAELSAKNAKWFRAVWKSLGWMTLWNSCNGFQWASDALACGCCHIYVWCNCGVSPLLWHWKWGAVRHEQNIKISLTLLTLLTIFIYLLSPVRISY